MRLFTARLPQFFPKWNTLLALTATETMTSPSLPNFSLQKCPAPCLNVNGGFITAQEQKKQQLLSDIELEERKLDAAKLLIELKMGVWGTHEENEAWWKNMAFHFKDKAEGEKLV